MGAAVVSGAAQATLGVLFGGQSAEELRRIGDAVEVGKHFWPQDKLLEMINAFE